MIAQQTNGAGHNGHSLNGHGLNGNGHYRRPKPDKSLWREFREQKFTDFVPVPTIIIWVVAGGLGVWNMIHPQPPPSPEELAAQRAKAARIEELQSEIDVRQSEIDARRDEIDELDPPDQYERLASDYR
jgi:hypothetical protein